MTELLHTPILLADLELKNRVVMAPMTRNRAIGNVANQLMATYYGQRSEAGLIITEGTAPSPDGLGYARIPGLFDREQAAGWRLVTDAVHARGGRIQVQLWHPGRAAHSSLNNGVQPISSTDRAIKSSRINTPTGEHDYEVPRRLALAEIPGIGLMTATALAVRIFASPPPMMLKAKRMKQAAKTAPGNAEARLRQTRPVPRAALWRPPRGRARPWPASAG